MLWNVFGQVVDDAQEGVRIPEGAIPIASYENPWQYSSEQGNRFQWEDWMPRTGEAPAGMNIAPGYISTLLQWADAADAGTLKPYEQEQWENLKRQAMSVPLRYGTDFYGGWGPKADDPNASRLLNVNSPDIGHFMLTVRDKMKRGTATAEERALFQDTARQAADWDFRASVPQASDANPFGLGDNLVGALMMLGLGATGGAAAGAVAASGLTLASAGGLLATAGGITGMLSEPLDSNALRMAGLAMGTAGGATSLASLLSNGLNSVGDVVKAVQRVYGTSQKGMALVQAAQQAGNNPVALAQAQQPTPERFDPNNPHHMLSMDPAYQNRPLGSRTQAQTYSGDTRSSFLMGGGNTGSSGGGGMERNLNPYEAVGGILTGVVGLAGAGLSLADIARYMGQLKDQYKDEQAIQTLIDQAYQLAKSRYEQYYNQTQRQDEQGQEAYRKSVERADTYYNQTQGEQAQRQSAYQDQTRQIAEDRAEQQAAYRDDRQRVISSFEQRQQALLEEFNQQKAIYGENRARQTTNFDARQAELLQNRQKELAVFDADYAKKNAVFDRQLGEIAEERGMGMEGWRASYNIGRNLSDPAAIKAGAEGIYRPLSDLAVQRISDEVSVDRSLRGLSGPGQYGDYLAAKAYAPFENQLWETALNSYITGQRGAIDAYGNRTLARSPDYDMTNVPDFTTREQWTDMTLPNYTDLAQFAYGNRPVYEQQSGRNVPGTVPYSPNQVPGVPGAINPAAAPFNRGYTATPYAPFGTTAQTGGGPNGPIGQLSTLVGQLARLAPQLAPALQQLFGGGNSSSPHTEYPLEEALGPAYGGQYDAWNYGITNPQDAPYDAWSWNSGDYGMNWSDYDLDLSMLS